MTWPLFLGCAGIAYGPSLITVLFFIVPRAPLLLVTLTSAFFWLLSIFLTSLVWFAIPPLQEAHVITVILAVLFQEAVRGCFTLVYSRTEKGVKAITPDDSPMPLNDLASAIAAGISFGSIQSVVMHGSLLATATGPGSLYRDTCPAMSIYVESALLSLFFVFIHTEAMILAFDAYRRSSWMRFLLGSVLLHMTASVLTAFNEVQGGCQAVVPAVLVVALVGAAACVYVVRQPDYMGTKQAKAWRAAVENWRHRARRRAAGGRG